MSPYPFSVFLALAMVVIALSNALLMAWLWRFPMIPDATASNPHGRSSAPSWAVALHRCLGYGFILVWITLGVMMVPRLWRFQEWPLSAVFHAALGIAVGLVLIVKIGVIRRYPQYSGALPFLGGLLVILTLSVAGLGLVPIREVLNQSNLSPLAQQGQTEYATRCLQCHGASVVSVEFLRNDKWHRAVEKMQKRARRSPALDISPRERRAITAFLIETRGWKKD